MDAAGNVGSGDTGVDKTSPSDNQLERPSEPSGSILREDIKQTSENLRSHLAELGSYARERATGLRHPFKVRSRIARRPLFWSGVVLIAGAIVGVGWRRNRLGRVARQSGDAVSSSESIRGIPSLRGGRLGPVIKAQLAATAIDLMVQKLRKK